MKTVKTGDITYYRLVSCPACQADVEMPCRDSQGAMKHAVHTLRMAMFRLRSPTGPTKRVEN